MIIKKTKNIGSNTAFALIISLSLSSTVSFASQELTESVEQLVQNVELACPTVWEDLGVKIVNEGSTATLWDSSNSADQDSYINFHLSKTSTPDSLTTAEQNEVLSNTDIVVADCTAARTALLSKFYSNLPQDVVAAMAGLDYEPGEVVDGFEIGDIRHTGRQQSADGWVFLHGVQTIGSSGSDATLKGNDYRALFELAKAWAPNTGNEVWGSGNTVTLPNMTGRTLVAGSSSDIGTTFGQQSMIMTPAQLPTHSHTMNSKGHHNHTVGNDTHSHAIRTSAFEGGGGAPAGWDYFGKARPRPGYQLTFPANKAIISDTHRHTLTGAGSHKHTIDQVGDSQAFELSQPSLRVRVEMKYK